MRRYLFLILAIAALGAQSCKFYKQDIILRTEEMPDSLLVTTAQQVASNYPFRVNDWVFLKVYTNDGEQLVDPNFMFTRQVFSSTGTTQGGGGAGMNMMGMQQNQPQIGAGASINTSQFGHYLISVDSTCYLPLVGKVKLAGLTYAQADSILNIKYSEYYEDAFVMTRAVNRRVVVIRGVGATGVGGVTAGGFGAFGGSLVYPMEHENVHLLEVLAGTGGIPTYGKSQRIRIIRGDLNNPQVRVIDLQYLHKIPAQDLRIQPNDIIYVEPGRRPALELVKETSTFLALPVSLISLIIVLATR